MKNKDQSYSAEDLLHDPEFHDIRQLKPNGKGDHSKNGDVEVLGRKKNHDSVALRRSGNPGRRRRSAT